MDEILILPYVLEFYPLFNMFISNIFVPDMFLQFSDIVNSAATYLAMAVSLNA